MFQVFVTSDSALQRVFLKHFFFSQPQCRTAIGVGGTPAGMVAGGSSLADFGGCWLTHHHILFSLSKSLLGMREKETSIFSKITTQLYEMYPENNGQTL